MSKQKLSFNKIILLPFLIYFAVYFLFFLNNSKAIITYSIVYISSSFIFIFLCIYILKINLPKKYVYFLLAAGMSLRFIFIFIEPIGSDDYYRYLWDGKVLAQGINPYEYAPSDINLSKFHSVELPSHVSFPKIKTISPPLSEALFYAAYKIGGESFFGLKILIFIFELFTIFGLLLILKESKLNVKNILLYSLAPLPLFELLINAHVDGFGLPLLIFGIYFYLRKKNNISLIFIGLSICVKYIGIILLPILFFTQKDMKEKIKVIIIPLIVIMLSYLPFIFSANVFEALKNFTINWEFNGSVFESVNSFLNNNQVSRLVCGILFLIVYIPVILSKKNLLNKIYLSIFLLLIFSPVVHPWYLTWLAIIVVFVPRWSGIFFINLVSLTVITVVNYKLNGVWKNYPLVMMLEYVPVFFTFFYELLSNKPVIEGPPVEKINNHRIN